MQAVKVAKTVNFKCGCLATEHLRGDLEELDGWTVILCREHWKNKEEVREKAEECWTKLNNGRPTPERSQKR